MEPFFVSIICLCIRFKLIKAQNVIIQLMHVNGLKDTIEWYDSHAEQYAEASASYFNMNHISKFADELPKGASVLDAGCGPGRDANILSQQGLRVTGLDISAGLLKVARWKYPDIEFVEGDLLFLPFNDESFDGVWSNASLLHLEAVDDVKKALSEISRVLKPAGVLHMVVKSQTGDSKTAVVSDKLSGHDRFFQYFKKEEVTMLLEGAGFSVLHSQEYDEVEIFPHGRPEVRFIWCLARKN